jgi:hypothetical protein
MPTNLNPSQLKALRWLMGVLCLAAYLWVSETDYQDFLLTHPESEVK